MSIENRRRFTKLEREAVYRKYNGHCAYCGFPINIEDMQVDHMNSLYGHDGTNEMENLMPACRSCNHYKSTYNLERFRSQLERIPSVLSRDKSTFRLAEKFELIRQTPHRVTFYFERIDSERRCERVQELRQAIVSSNKEYMALLMQDFIPPLDVARMDELSARVDAAAKELRSYGIDPLSDSADSGEHFYDIFKVKESKKHE